MHAGPGDQVPWPLWAASRESIPSPTEHSRCEGLKTRPHVLLLQVGMSDWILERENRLSPLLDISFLVKVISSIDLLLPWPFECVREQRPIDHGGEGAPVTKPNREGCSPSELARERRGSSPQKEQRCEHLGRKVLWPQASHPENGYYCVE